MAMKAAVPAHPRRKFSMTDVKRGRLDVPQRVLAFGVEKVGKSTFAAGAPSPVFLCPENGTPHLDVERLPTPETWDELFDVLGLVETSSWKTLVIDPVNWLEDLCWARVVGGPDARFTEATRDEIEKYGGGYKKGYEAAAGHWRSLVSTLERAHYGKGRNVVFLAHAFVKAFRDPSGVEYERYEVQMHPKAAGLLRQWVDDVLFLRHEVLRKVEGSRAVAVATGARVIHTEWSKAWDAGNRSALPSELPLSWSEYWTAVEAGRTRIVALKKDIGSLIEEIGDVEVTRKATAMVAEAKDNGERLAEIANALRVKLAEVKGQR